MSDPRPSKEVVERMRAIAKAIYNFNAFRANALDDLADEVEQLLQPAHEPSEVAWLIEMQFDGKAHWWYGSDFIDDANQAVRFSRKGDAEQVIMERGLVDAVATEHMWCSGPSLTKSEGGT